MDLELKDVIHFYLGCEVETTDGIGKMISVSNYDHVTVTLVGDRYFNLKEIKPLLRPLESMTERQAIEFVKLNVVENRNEQIEICEINKNHIWYIDGEMWHADGVSEMYDKYVKFNELSPEQFAWLCENSFDIFNLIPRGLAIDKTKYESQPLQDRAEEK